MKKNLYKVALILIVTGNICWVNAQKSDTKSKQILDAVAKNYKSKKNTYFKFIFGVGSNGKISQAQTGIFYTTPSQYKLKVMGIEQIFDGTKVYNVIDEDKEITIAKATGSEMMFSPTNYLNTYNKDYNTSYVGKRKAMGINTEMIKLTPVKNNGIKSVYIFVNPTNYRLAKIEQYAADNSISVIEIKDYKENQVLDPNMFVFDKSRYKDYVITEL